MTKAEDRKKKKAIAEAIAIRSGAENISQRTEQY